MMRKRVAGAVLLAGLAMSGTGAFTNSNDVVTSRSGVGDAVVSGATVTDIDYTVAAHATTGEDEISVVAFTADASMADQEVILRLKDGAATDASADTLGDLDACVIVTTRATCTFTAASRADLVDVDGVEIVVYDND